MLVRGADLVEIEELRDRQRLLIPRCGSPAITLLIRLVDADAYGVARNFQNMRSARCRVSTARCSARSRRSPNICSRSIFLLMMRKAQFMPVDIANRVSSETALLRPRVISNQGAQRCCTRWSALQATDCIIPEPNTGPDRSDRVVGCAVGHLMSPGGAVSGWTRSELTTV